MCSEEAGVKRTGKGDLHLPQAATYRSRFLENFECARPKHLLPLFPLYGGHLPTTRSRSRGQALRTCQVPAATAFSSVLVAERGRDKSLFRLHAVPLVNPEEEEEGWRVAVLGSLG